jgi:cell division inhibitor SulA
MPRYVIERDIPEIGSAEREALREAARKSNGVLAEMRAEKKNIQWEHSYVAGDKTFCIYLADEEAFIQEHAQRSGFPATKVTEVRTMIDPVTAEARGRR